MTETHLFAMMNRFFRLSSLPLGVVLLVLAGILVASPSRAQEQDDRIRTADYDVRDLSYPELRDFAVPEPERIELDNGMIVFLLEDHELPRVRAVARIGTGSVYEPAEKRGLASITGTVMRTGGTATMAPDSLNQTLENIGATVETSIGETSGSAFMSTLVDHVDTVFPVFAEVLRQPAFAEEKLSQAKSQQASAISRRNDNAQQIAFREFDKLVYGEESPYARTPEYYTIDRIERQDLVDFHGRYYHPRNIILSIWGDFDIETMAQRVREQFGDWESEGDVGFSDPPDPTTSREYSVNFIQKDDVNQSTVLMGHPGSLTRDDPDYPSVTIMNEVLSGGFSGRLFQNVRREKGLAYSVLGGYSAGYDRPGRFYAGVSSRSETTVEATRAVMDEVERMRTEPPTEEELSLAKDSYLNSFVFNFDTKREILSRLMTYEYYDYPADFLQQTRDAVEDVTAEDVHGVSAEYLYPDESHVLIVGRRQDFQESLSALTRGGDVNEIDISIPTRPPAEDTSAEVDEEAATAGQELLSSAKEALGGAAFDQISTLKMIIEQQGNESTLIVELPDRLRTEINTPMGSVTVVDDGETMQMQTPQGTRTAPPQVREQVTAQLWQSVPYLLANLDHEALSLQAEGEETIDGTSYEVVQVDPPVGDSYTLYLEAERLWPQRLTLETMNPQSGATVRVEQVFRDYREVEGITIPFTTETTQSTDEGEQTVTSTLQQIEVNPDLEEGVFTLDEAASGSE